MPGTSGATWPMSYHNYRARVCRYLRAEEHAGQLFYEGRNLWAVESLGTESLATHILDALPLRGVEDDAEAVARFACSRRSWTAGVARRVATLERYLDVARVFRGYTWGDLPTRYLVPYAGLEALKKLDAVARRRSGTKAWPQPMQHRKPGAVVRP